MKSFFYTKKSVESYGMLVKEVVSKLKASGLISPKIPFFPILFSQIFSLLFPIFSLPNIFFFFCTLFISFSFLLLYFLFDSC